MATLTPTSPADSFIVSDGSDDESVVSDSGDDDSVWAMDLDDDDAAAADTPVLRSPVGPNVTVGRVCARAAAARARALDRARAMARADAYLDLNGEAGQAHAARQLRLDHLRRECGGAAAVGGARAGERAGRCGRGRRRYWTRATPRTRSWPSSRPRSQPPRPAAALGGRRRRD